MNRRLVLLGATVAACGPLAGQAGATTSTQVKRVVSQEQAEFAQRYAPHGMAIVVVAPDGDALRTHTFTYGTPSGARPRARVRPSTQFEIGSVTKVFTTALLTDAATRNIVNRGQKAQSLMPAGEKLPTYPEGPPTDENPGCADGQMTLLQLGGHRSGFQKALPGFGDSAEYRAQLTAQQLFDAIEPMKLEFCPGTAYQYSNIGVGLLGTLLALKQNTTYGALIADRITKPLRMNSTRLEAPSSRLSGGHCSDGKLTEPWNNVGALAGGGGLMSSITDMGRFIRAHLGQGDPTTVAALAETRDQTSYNAGAGKGRAIGWTFQESAGLAGRYYMKNGATKGFSSALAVAPEERYGVAILVNRVGTQPDQLGIDITERLLGVTLKGDPDDDEFGC